MASTPTAFHAVFHHGIERAGELGLAEIVLVLADANRLRIDLDQLGQGILQAPRDRDRAANGDVEVGQFVRGEGRGRVDRCAGFGDHDLGHLALGQPLHELGGELVGLARGGAVADRNQLDAMLDRELAENGERLIPAPLRLVRENRRMRHHLAGRIDHRDLDAGAIPGIEPHGGARAGRRREQEVAQIRGEHAHRLGLGRRPQPQPQIDVEVDLDFGAPGPAHRLGQPFVALAALVGDRKAVHDLELVEAGLAYDRLLRLRLDGEVEDLFLLAAEQRQDAMRRQLRQRLGEIEIVLELLAFGLLPGADGRGHDAVRPHLLTQRADQVGILGEALDQDRARAVERRGDVGDLLLGIDEGRRGLVRIALGLRQKLIGERLEAGLLGDLGLGATLRLVRQIDVLEPALAVGGHDLSLERGVELALLADRIEHRGTALLELAQIRQPLFQRTQLGIIKRAGELLAVSRDERHRGAAVEQRHRRLDLFVANPQLLRNLMMNLCHACLSEIPLRRRITDGAEVAYEPSRIDSSRRAVDQIGRGLQSISGMLAVRGLTNKPAPNCRRKSQLLLHLTNQQVGTPRLRTSTHSRRRG
ncbi:hypothetical protein ACVIWU_001303 [Bradyrhizobium sp. USDA 4509]